MPDTTLIDDEVFDMANLSEARTGVPGVIYISTREGKHAPRVKYFERAGRDQPSFSVSISESPAVLVNSLSERSLNRASPKVIEWVKLNQRKLLKFWNEGDTWMKEQVDAHIEGLTPVR